MKYRMEDRLKDFFAEEVEARREPVLPAPKPSRWRGVAAGGRNILAAAACLVILWVTVAFRPVHPLDQLVSQNESRIALEGIIKTSALIVEISLVKEKQE